MYIYIIQRECSVFRVHSVELEDNLYPSFLPVVEILNNNNKKLKNVMTEKVFISLWCSRLCSFIFMEVRGHEMTFDSQSIINITK